jgi:tRNA pseudouridine38-40 synthase
LVRFGYDGSDFAGWARQPGRRTVEGEIRRRLRRIEMLESDDAFGLEVASRTDRGVSARANALVLSAQLPAPVLLRALNGISSEIFFTAATEVDSEFRVRRARSRTYRYYEAPAPKSSARWREAANEFRGAIDVRSLGRGLRRDEPTIRRVDALTIEDFPGGVCVEITAPAFVWGMVRKVVAALREIGDGRLSIARLRRALAGEECLTLPLAEPEPLVLWEVDFGLPWTYRWTGPNRHQARWWERESAAGIARREVLQAIGLTFAPDRPR